MCLLVTRLFIRLIIKENSYLILRAEEDHQCRCAQMVDSDAYNAFTSAPGSRRLQTCIPMHSHAIHAAEKRKRNLAEIYPEISCPANHHNLQSCR